MPVNDILATADVSTSATDFQASGTAAPGSTGRVADAGHIHPAGSASVGYEIVTQNVVTPGGTTQPGEVTVAAPTGKKVVGGGFDFSSLVSNYGTSYVPKVYTDGPAADGSAWLFEGEFYMGANGFAAGFTLGTVYAICIDS